MVDRVSILLTGASSLDRERLEKLVAACDVPAHVYSEPLERAAAALGDAVEPDLLLAAWPADAGALAAALGALDGRLPIVLLATEMSEQVASLAYEHGARVCLFSHGPSPLRLAIRAAARDAAARRPRSDDEDVAERVRALVHSSVSDVVFTLRVEDDRFRFVEINTAFLRATGLPVDRVVGKLVEEVIPEPSLSLVLSYYRQAIAERRTVRWEEITPYPAGTKYGEVSVTPVTDSHGRCTRLVGTVQDVTENRRQAETIRRYADVVRNVQIPLTVWNVPDPAAVTLAAYNPAAAELAGRDLAPLLGRPMEQVDDVWAAPILDLVREVARDGKVREARVGETRCLVAKVFPLPGASVGLALEDVTPQERARRIAAAEQRALELVASGAPLERTIDELVRGFARDIPGASLSVRVLPLGSSGAASADSDPPASWSTPIAASNGRVLGTVAARYPGLHAPAAGDADLLARLTHVAGIAIQRHQLDEQLRELSAHIDAAREEERTGIARELHDQLGQSLTVLKMDLAWIARRASADGLSREALLEKVASLVQMADEMIGEVRRLSAELRPAILDHVGLAAALQWSASAFAARSHIPCDVDCRLPEDAPIARRVATAVFRVFQEALTNVARHAGARHVDVDVAIEDEGAALVLRVSDDGRGITRDEIEDPRSLGLLGIRERARRLGGGVTFARRDPSGTVVTLRVPLADDEASTNGRMIDAKAQ